MENPSYRVGSVKGLGMFGSLPLGAKIDGILVTFHFKDSLDLALYTGIGLLKASQLEIKILIHSPHKVVISNFLIDTSTMKGKWHKVKIPMQLKKKKKKEIEKVEKIRAFFQTKELGKDSSWFTYRHGIHVDFKKSLGILYIVGNVIGLIALKNDGRLTMALL